MKECCRKYLNEQFGGDTEVVDAIYAEYVSSLGPKLAADKAIALRNAAKLQNRDEAERLIAGLKSLAEGL